VFSRSGLACLLFAVAALVVAEAGAISRPLPDAGLPWGDRVSPGIELQVAVAPTGALRARDRVTFRFQVADETGRPMAGLRPTAWMEPLEAGETVDPAACIQEMETGAGWKLVKEPTLLDLALREGERPGIYEAVARMGRPGRYEVAFFLGSPRLVHCFEVEIQPS